MQKANNAKQYEFADKGEDLDKLWEARRGCYMAAISYRELKGDRVYLSVRAGLPCLPAWIRAANA